MININSDMGEGFGIYKLGDDEALMPYITEANVACGFHASDPNHMKRTVELAKQYDVKVGAHFSLPDLQGFGRRKMHLSQPELHNMIVYQIGALKGFLDMLGMPLNHLKPHGILYGMAASDPEIAETIANIALHYDVPVFGLTNTSHETVYKRKGVTFVPEFFTDLDYDQHGHLVITQTHDATDPIKAAKRVLKAVEQGTVIATNGDEIPVSAQTVCVHSDTPNALDIVKAVNAALKHHLPQSSKEFDVS
ncbi:LamB/YcsF family protein [Vibrio nigripulchritudo]|uniref:5-oxoprolinase subunit PxpA n=1 Tax=Vibrio nigripulchritudo TaxID=28173 RepID=UPI00190C757D|nr:5-oxoprolinase subunit PxpA [Vibrio nigripulchritudo]BCL72369.1 LamB/YcsF family protein [Vibrio nigripulchritudo]BDU33730.1 LamB/YcsF family protein [Vibrio nigripulchritudo]